MDGVASDGQPRTAQVEMLRRLYGGDIWADYVPKRPRQAHVQGWNGHHGIFNRAVAEAPNAIFVDVGVWKGQSTLYVADLIRASGRDGCVVSVDTFLGSVEHWTEYVGLFDRRMGRPDLFETFLENVCYAGLTRYVVPLPTISVTAARILQHFNIAPGAVHVDASHQYDDVMADARAFWAILPSGGFLIGDDYVPQWPDVIRAAQDFAAEVADTRMGELVVDFPKWILRKR